MAGSPLRGVGRWGEVTKGGVGSVDVVVVHPIVDYYFRFQHGRELFAVE